MKPGEFEKIDNSLKDLPVTWYPSLMMTIITESIKKGGTWKKGMINIFVKKIEDKVNSGEIK